MITASDRPSLKPSLEMDAHRDLHLTWLEPGGFGLYRVAYASTAPGVRRAYNALTLWDVMNAALGVAMKLFLAVGLGPILAAAWTVLPLLCLIGYHLVTGHEHLTAPGGRLILGVCMLLLVAGTYVLSPYRGSLQPALEWTLPIATAAVALVLTVVVLRRRDGQSLFGALFLFALVHSVLQVAFSALLRL
jgi:hypothetical protein